jgi:hypothetical protein
MVSRRPAVIAFVEILLACIIIIAVTLVAAYSWLAMVGLAPTPFDCTTEVRGRTFGVSGFDFEISETYCDTIAKSAAISVFASKSGNAKKVLLFKFVPSHEDLLPVITQLDQHSVRISIPEISSMLLIQNKIEDLNVNYKIDIIDYPDSDTGEGE